MKEMMESCTGTESTTSQIPQQAKVKQDGVDLNHNRMTQQQQAGHKEEAAPFAFLQHDISMVQRLEAWHEVKREVSALMLQKTENHQLADVREAADQLAQPALHHHCEQPPPEIV
jgi:hypothetical protein